MIITVPANKLIFPEDKILTMPNEEVEDGNK